LSKGTFFTSLTLLLLLLSSLASAQYLYRYTDENGRMVLNSFIPPEYAGAGYEVLDARTGELIQVIAAKAEDEEGADIVYLSPEDRILLASYSEVEEIEAHLARKTAGLRAEIANIHTDLRILGEELEEKRAELDRLVEREREIPEELTAHIAELEESDAGLNAALTRREFDLTKTEHEYQEKMARFEVLLNSEHR